MYIGFFINCHRSVQRSFCSIFWMSTLPTRLNGTGGLPGILRSTFAVSEKSADFEFDRSVG